MITIDCSLADMLKKALNHLDQGQIDEARMLITSALKPIPISHLREIVRKHISVFLSSKKPGDVFHFTEVKEYLKLALGFNYGQGASLRSLVIRRMILRRLEHLKKERIIFSVVHGGTSYSVGFSLLSED